MAACGSGKGTAVGRGKAAQHLQAFGQFGGEPDFSSFLWWQDIRSVRKQGRGWISICLGGKVTV